MAGDRNKNVILALLLTLPALITFSRIITTISSWQLQTKWSAFTAVSTHLWFVPSTRIVLANAVDMVLGSSYLSARKIVVLIRGTKHYGEVEAFECKLNTENIWR